MDFLQGYILFSIFISGTVIGSFLNCLIWRSYCQESAAKGRSYCPNCRHTLAWFDLVPVLSFLSLKGKCRYCAKPISWQYPLVELAAGFLFVLAVIAFTPQILAGNFSSLLISKFLAYCVLFCALTVVFVADLRWYYIPDGAVLTGILAGAAITFFNAGGGYPWRFFMMDAVWASLLSAVFAGTLFLAIFLVSRGKWIGFGDVKFAFMMGLVLGFPGILVGMFFANFFGAILGLALVSHGKKKMTSQLPFGPFLVAGTAIGIFFSDAIFDWYLSLMF